MLIFDIQGYNSFCLSLISFFAPYYSLSFSSSVFTSFSFLSLLSFKLPPFTPSPPHYLSLPPSPPLSPSLSEINCRHPTAHSYIGQLTLSISLTIYLPTEVIRAISSHHASGSFQETCWQSNFQTSQPHSFVYLVSLVVTLLTNKGNVDLETPHFQFCFLKSCIDTKLKDVLPYSKERHWQCILLFSFLALFSLSRSPLFPQFC